MIRDEREPTAEVQYNLRVMLAWQSLAGRKNADEAKSYLVGLTPDELDNLIHWSKKLQVLAEAEQLRRQAK